MSAAYMKTSIYGLKDMPTFAFMVLNVIVILGKVRVKFSLFKYSPNSWV